MSRKYRKPHSELSPLLSPTLSKTAADNTINLLDGKTDAERAEEAAIIASGADISEEPRGPAETIEQAANRYRSQAFAGQEWTTKLFGDTRAEDSEYRITLRGGWAYLEQTRGMPNGGAYHYAGVMFPEKDMMKLATEIVKVARTLKDKP